jgi:hypothetical protein
MWRSSLQSKQVRYDEAMSDARRRVEETAAEPRAKAIARPASEAWRVHLGLWSADDRFAWAERAAIMIADAGLSVEDAEYAAFLDVQAHRTR